MIDMIFVFYISFLSLSSCSFYISYDFFVMCIGFKVIFSPLPPPILLLFSSLFEQCSSFFLLSSSLFFFFLYICGPFVSITSHYIYFNFVFNYYHFFLFFPRCSVKYSIIFLLTLKKEY